MLPLPLVTRPKAGNNVLWTVSGTLRKGMAMKNSIERRKFLAGSVAAAAAAAGLSRPAKAQKAGKAKQEYYEFREYRVKNAEKQKIVSNYLEKALLPALNRMGIDRVGVFNVKDKPKDLTIFVLIAYPSPQALADLNPKLAADGAYQKAAAELFALPKKDPAYVRIVSRFMKAFAGIPVLELPAQTKAKSPRMFELRVYESHNEDKALRKVEMFNSGEIQVMRDTKLGPVFFGEMLIGDNVPNLTYMLSAGDMESHKAHWKAFGGHPEWIRMKGLPKYKDTVSKITKSYLVPTAYSQV